MRVTIAIDSFKGSLSTTQAGEAVKEGILSVYNDAIVDVRPLADGGEGTVDAVVSATGGDMVEVTVSGPLGTPVVASYGIIPDTNTAIIEMSSAAGITLIDAKDRNPLNTSTYGVGEMIADAIGRGCRRFIVGIGGSATNDGGVGMLQALGFEFFDLNGNPVARRGEGLKDIARISNSNAMSELEECEFFVACDVKNVLCGTNGCSAVYGPQKGATKDMIKDMDLWLGRYAILTREVFPDADATYPGTGAAGGLGFAFLSYLNATLESGVDLVIRETGLEEYIKDSDIVVTGEGRLDGQSYMGKAPIGVARIAKKYGKPVVAFSGCVTDDAIECNNHGIDAFFPVLRTPCTLEEAMDVDNAYKNARDTAIQVFKLIKEFK